MKLCVALECRFTRLPDGSVWTENQYATSFWDPYLAVFDHVRCLARVRDVRWREDGWQRADSDRVSFSAVPAYHGGAQFIRRFVSVRQAIHRAIRPGHAYLLRLPGPIGELAGRQLRKMDYPYAVEVLGDPYEVFSPGAVRHPLRAFLRRYAPRQLRRHCADACAVSYVTDTVLQRRYPSAGVSTAASDIDLDGADLVSAPRTFTRQAGPTRLIFVGSLEQYYKAPDVLIRAFAACQRRGIDLELTIIGEGRHRPSLIALAEALGCARSIRFVGSLPRAQVFAELDRADLFVLPSRTEGLPRAMIEAMARGLPCVGTNVGGIPELLPPDALVPRNDWEALAATVARLVASPERLGELSRRNLTKAASYEKSVLWKRRTEFYHRLRQATEAQCRGNVPAAPWADRSVTTHHAHGEEPSTAIAKGLR